MIKAGDPEGFPAFLFHADGRFFLERYKNTAEMKLETKLETEEEFISGFCKMNNQTRMVICETEVLSDGKKRVIYADCAYGTCEHTGDCLLMGKLNE